LTQEETAPFQAQKELLFNGVGKGLFFKHRALTDASSFERCPKLFLKVFK
jgi:hypothetical protein